MNRLLVACGRRIGGKSEMTFDRTHFIKEGPERHITESELSKINSHLHGGDSIGEAELEGFGVHVRRCNKCAEKIHSLPSVVFDEESVHTSLPPDHASSVYCRPDHEEKFVIQDITNWDDEIVH